MSEDHLAQVLHGANKELVEIARRSEPSVLRCRTYDGMSSERWMSCILDELSTRCPIVNNILSGLLESQYRPEKKNPAMCLIYGIIMFLRCHELSQIQRINSVLLIQGQATVNVSAMNTSKCAPPWQCFMKFLYTINKQLLSLLLYMTSQVDLKRNSIGNCDIKTVIWCWFPLCFAH